MPPPRAHLTTTTEVLGVRVEEGPIPEPWSDTGLPGCCADRDRVRYQSAGAVLYVEAGSRIALRCADAIRRRHDHLVYSVGARWLLLQRGRLTLHACVVVAPEGDRVVALAGLSGAGKTTALTRLLRRGWRLVADDTCEIQTGAAGVVARPWCRPVHLAPAHIEYLGGSVPAGPPLPFAAKYAMWLPQDLTPRALTHLFIVSTTPSGPLLARALAPAEAMVHLLNVTLAGTGLLGALPEYRAEHVRWAAAISAAVPTTLVSRPRDRDTADQVVTAIEHAVAVAAPTAAR